MPIVHVATLVGNFLVDSAESPVVTRNGEDAGLLAGFPLTETAGPTLQNIEGADGVYVGSPTLAQAGVGGRYPLAPLFNGSSQYGSGPVAGVKLPVTISGWVRATLGAAQVPFALVDADASDVYYALRIEAGGSLTILRSDGTTYSHATSAIVPNDVWTHVALSLVDATSANVFLNGILVANPTTLSPLGLSSAVDSVAIGVLRLTSPTAHFAGRVNDVRVRRVALTSDRVRETMMSAFRAKIHGRESLSRI